MDKEPLSNVNETKKIKIKDRKKPCKSKVRLQSTWEKKCLKKKQQHREACKIANVLSSDI